MPDRRRTGEDLDDSVDDETPLARARRAARAARRPECIHATPSADRREETAAEVDPERDRRVRRARFLAELAEARELRKRVTPRRTRAAELHERVLRTFRY